MVVINVSGRGDKDMQTYMKHNKTDKRTQAMKLTQNTTVISADLETPVGLYLKIRDLYPCSALLESSDYHTTQNSTSIIRWTRLAR